MFSYNNISNSFFPLILEITLYQVNDIKNSLHFSINFLNTYPAQWPSKIYLFFLQQYQ